MMLEKNILFINEVEGVNRRIGEGGGVATQKNRTLPQISNLGLVFFRFFFWFFRFFFGFSILANFDWFNGFSLSGSCWLK